MILILSQTNQKESLELKDSKFDENKCFLN